MLKKTLLKLLTIPGPSGYESACADYIESEMKPFVDTIARDVMGNLICTKKGSGGKRIMLTAHMDEIGFVVTAIEERGFLRVTTLGGVNPKITLASHVTLKSGAPGVLFQESGSEGQLFIDVGASSREEAEALAQIGDWAVVRGTISDMGSRIAAPYLDDRSGCAVLMETLRSLPATDNEIVAVFTTQEEVGLRGAQTAGYAVDPDMAIALDVTIAGDIPRASETNSYVVSRLGQGAAVKIMDRGIIAHPSVVETMENAARKAGVPWQREVLTGGSTDVGAIHKGRGGVPAGTLSIPCRYVHAPCEMVDLRDMEGAVRILTAML
ncbi:MAG: M42 family metallopeptidase [Candidatus Spyradocola sp.]